jgi:hypothetical protein
MAYNVAVHHERVYFGEPPYDVLRHEMTAWFS